VPAILAQVAPNFRWLQRIRFQRGSRFP